MIARGPGSLREPPVAAAAGGDLYARVQRSVFAVLAGGSGGTGWVALDNGLLVTSWRAVGFYSEVLLRHDDGRRGSGRVVHVDAERDVAFVLPAVNLISSRLSLRNNPLPRMGEQVSVLIAAPASSLVSVFATVSAESQGGGPALLEPDFASRAGRGGCPALDTNGNVVGLLTAGPHVGRGVHERSCRLLPVGFLARDLKNLDFAGSEIGERTLVYRCPTCSEPFSADHDRCHAGGVLLPHAFEVPPSFVGAERIVRDALSTLEIVSNRVRTGPRSWRILHRAHPGDDQPTEVLLRIDEDALQVILRVALVRLPSDHHEPFYRLLLTANDQSTGMCKLSLSGDVVMLTFAEPVSAFASEHDVAAVFHEMVLLAAQYRGVLADQFGAEPIREGSA